MGKRRRKDETEHHSLYRLNPMASHVLSYHAENVIDHQALCLPYSETDGIQPSSVAHKVDEAEVCDVANEVDDSHFRHTAEEADDDQPSQGTSESAPELPCTATDVVQQSSLESSEDVARQVEAH